MASVNEELTQKVVKLINGEYTEGQSCLLKALFRALPSTIDQIAPEYHEQFLQVLEEGGEEVYGG